MSITFDNILRELESGISVDQGIPDTQVQDALLQSIQQSMGIPGKSGGYPPILSPDTALQASIQDGLTLQYKAAPSKPEVQGNTLYGFANWHFDATGDYIIDGYDDATCPNSWADCIAQLEKTRRDTKRDWLLPHLFNHDKNTVIGGTMKLTETPSGVAYETKLASTNKAREIKSLCSDGLLGCSYGYTPVQVQHVYHEKSKKTIRKLVKVNISELSVCTFPANVFTTAGIKSRLHTGKVSHEYLLTLELRYMNALTDLLIRSR